MISVLKNGVPARAVDASGLSPTNRMSPAALVQLYRWIASSENGFERFIPKAKESSLGKYLRNSLVSRVRVKSGFMSGVWTYAGIIEGRSGDKKYFALMYEDHNAKGSEVRRSFARILDALDND